MMYMDQFKADARIAQKEAEGQYPFRTYSLSTKWSVELEHARFISLINTNWMYTGGAHGNTFYESLAFDRKHRRIIKLSSLFNGEEAEAKARKTIRTYVIKDILRQKAERMEKPVEGFKDEWVSNGVEGKFQVSTLEPSDQKGKVAGLRMWYGPYAVRSFAAGPFDAFVPATVSTFSIQTVTNWSFMWAHWNRVSLRWLQKGNNNCHG